MDCYASQVVVVVNGNPITHSVLDGQFSYRAIPAIYESLIIILSSEDLKESLLRRPLTETGTCPNLLSTSAQLSFLQMRLFFSPNHVQLIAACYPPSASLVTSGPHYHPNAQELSRLTYYAANKPGKIQKLSGELQKRIKLEARKALPNNPRSRA